MAPGYSVWCFYSTVSTLPAEEFLHAAVVDGWMPVMVTRYSSVVVKGDSVWWYKGKDDTYAKQ